MCTQVDYPWKKKRPAPLSRALVKKTSTAPARIFLAFVGLTATATAHHSAAMFDMAHVITLTGTVTEFQWTNPHCFIQLAVPAGSAVDEWSLEMASPMTLFAHGWRKGSVRPGDKITVDIHPMRDGGKGGALVSAMTANKKPIGVNP